MTGEVEIVVVADGGVFLDGATAGERWEGIRVRYRQAGTRRWSKFIAVGQDGQSLLDLLTAAVVAVARSDDDQAARGKFALGDQLELGAPA